MSPRSPFRRTRRDFLWAGLVTPAVFILASSQHRPWPSVPDVLAGESTLTPTPSCGENDEPTPKQTEGPYYKRRSPARQTLLEPGVTGTPLHLSGLVLSQRCQPINGVLLDFWQANDRGEYDNKGYRLRGHQFTDATGHFRLETVVPGIYPGRTRHIHVKVQAPNRPVLTSQLYFPGEPRNQQDRLFLADLLLTVEEASGGQKAVFNFVLDIA